MPLYNPAASSSTPGFGTSLPGSPSNGDEYILTDSTSAPTYAWRFRYVSAKSSNKWVFIGGNDLLAAVDTNETTSSSSYTALTTAGPSVAVPVAGDYIVSLGAQMTNDVGGKAARMSYDIGATGAVDGDGIVDYGVAGSNYIHLFKKRKKTGLTAVTLTCKYKSELGSNASFADRYISILPIAIGG